jgi:Cof subfamily protein (haloacid dehalogenase superfamily)
MGRKLLISDLDGTLLDQYDSLSLHWISELNEMIQNGLNFTIATGRDIKKAKKAINGLNLEYPVILTNGALLADINTGKYLKITTINPIVVDAIMDHAEQIQQAPMVFAAYDSKKDYVYFHKGKWGPKNEIQWLPPEKYKPFQKLDIVSIQFHAKKELLEPFKDWLEQYYKEKINLVYIEDVGYRNATNIPGWFWLEINSYDAGKEKMLRTLAEYCDVNLQDIVAFGDNQNDINMLKIVGRGVAVANAPQEVQKAATDICPPNTEGGVIKFIKNHLSEFI